MYVFNQKNNSVALFKVQCCRIKFIKFINRFNVFCGFKFFSEIVIPKLIGKFSIRHSSIFQFIVPNFVYKTHFLAIYNFTYVLLWKEFKKNQYINQ